MKKILLITMLLFITNNATAYTYYLECRDNGGDWQYAGALKWINSKNYEKLIVEDSGHYIELLGHWPGYRDIKFYMDYIFSGRYEAQQFCTALLNECLTQFQGSSGDFEAYAYGQNQSLPVYATYYLDSKKKERQAESCSYLLQRG